jgi:murein DD-endopeptidase MepM/ murein hydrolase activator NlpD
VRRILAAATIAFAMLAGTAGADTFTVVPSNGAALPEVAAAPAAYPNAPGQVVVPPTFTSPPAVPETRTYAQLQALRQRAGAAYGIPWQVLGAINKVESNFGRNMGPSSAGAIGWMQFMPSTWLRWGTDANGDGIADPWNPEDAVFSAARYLAAAGGASDIYRAVYAYNHADWYVQEVLDLAHLYGQSDTIAFSLDRLQLRLDAARRRVATLGDRLSGRLSVVRALARRERPWDVRARTAPLLSDRLEAGRRAGILAGRRQAAVDAALRIQMQLAAAQRTLAQAERLAEPASFDNAAGMLLQAPTYSGGYVFPVGGGPGLVSAAHTHHDYPAVDIAAPQGSPVYALANATILRAWRYPDPRCGIGLTLQAFDGQVWTYCHLSVENADLRPGVHVNAGDQIGLVGMTGDATGPHLHLQLQPPTQWPQQESWFQSFAGSAFSWQDAPTPEPPGTDAAGPVVAFTTAAPASRSLASVAPAPEAPVFAVAPEAAPAGVDAAAGGVVLFTR